MEFHDVLHGHIRFGVGDPLTALVQDLIDSPEINRLRNMRQMNFDVPLIQELGRSRRLPHSIGVTYISSKLAERSGLSGRDTMTLVAAAMLHDAAIPPYGHLVESEFKSAGVDFKHERRVKDLINGDIDAHNSYLLIVPGKYLGLSKILSKYDVDPEAVIKVICPTSGKSPVSADIDLDNIDNVHRMAAMLGWSGARENVQSIVEGMSLRALGQMAYARKLLPNLEKWLDFRQRIYTMIIGHPECIPYNALQVDLVRAAVREKIISPNDWWLSEPEFEEALRRHESTKALASQLISGCSYHLIDYVWFKGFSTDASLSNAEIAASVTLNVDTPADHGYFVWNEKRLISRRIRVVDEHAHASEFGVDSASCMIALVKKTEGKPKWLKTDSQKWRREVTTAFTRIFGVHQFEVDFPETYSGEYLGKKSSELGIGYY